MRQPAKRSGANSFGRSGRLLKARDFQRVAREGRRVSSGRFVLLVAPSRHEARSADPVRIGITTSRKVGCAVTRNRIRRGVREWFRRSRACFGGSVDIVVIAKPGAAELRGSEMFGDLSALCEQWDATARRRRRG